MVGVTVSMVLDQECTCFFVTALSDEPSWAFRDEPGTEDDEARADGLQPKGQAPLDVAIEMEVATVYSFSNISETILQLASLIKVVINLLKVAMMLPM